MGKGKMITRYMRCSQAMGLGRCGEAVSQRPLRPRSGVMMMKAGGRWDHGSSLDKSDRFDKSGPLGFCAAVPLGFPTEGIRAQSFL